MYVIKDEEDIIHKQKLIKNEIFRIFSTPERKIE
jgi:hypothetical protein